MKKKRACILRNALAALAGAVTVVGSIQNGHSQDEQLAGNEITCDIEATATDGGLQLRGLIFVTGDKMVEGSYSLEVRNDNNGNTSNIRQGGSFQAEPGIPSKIGKVRLDGTNAAYEVELALAWDGGQAACEKTSMPER